jgi:hypothetical protein
MKLRCVKPGPIGALLLAFAPTSVLAAGVADTPIAEHDRAAVSLAFTGTTAPPNTAALIPTVAAALRTGPLLLTLDAATSFTSYRFPQQERGSVQRFANPVLGAQLSLFNRPELVLRSGLIAGAPLLTVPGGITNNVAAEHADRVAAAATGQRSYWMWARNVVPLAAFVRATTRFVDPLEFRVDAEPGVLLSVNRNPSYLALIVSAHVALRFEPVSAGVRWTTLVTSRPLDMHDFAQNTLAAFAQYDHGRFFGWADVVVGIDGPEGLAAESTPAWGGTLGGGIRFQD